MIPHFYKSEDAAFTLLDGDCIERMRSFEFEFDVIFADPPYFLSNGGITLRAGKVASVNKGAWDRSRGEEADAAFTREWVAAARKKLKPAGTLWACGTYHNIFSIARALKEENFKILNVITWVKTNPPPNLSCRYFTHASEFILWARKSHKVPHFFNYALMRHLNAGRQMRDVWTLPAVPARERRCGKHPTQKPLALLARILLASTRPGAWVFDPFAGSSTTGIAANLLGRRFLGIERDLDFCALSRKRKIEISNPAHFSEILGKLNLPPEVAQDGGNGDFGGVPASGTLRQQAFHSFCEAQNSPYGAEAQASALPF